MKVAVVPDPLVAVDVIRRRLVSDPEDGLRRVLELRRESALRREAAIHGDNDGGDLGGDEVVVLVDGGVGGARLDPAATVEEEDDGEAGDGVVVGGELRREVDSHPYFLVGVESDVFAEGGVAGWALRGLAGGGGGGEVEVARE